MSGAAAIRRRYLILSFTRWLPTGLLIPLLTIVPQQRGLSLAEIGLITAIGGAVVIALELPTGGLADVLGRRPVLLAATACNLASTGLIAFAGSFRLYALAWCIEGVYRALESGPLDAWYVDAAQRADPDVDIEKGLSRRGLVLSVAIGVGALASGGLSLLPQPSRLPVLALPILVSLGLRVVDAIALAVLLQEDRPPAEATDSRLAGALAAVRGDAQEGVFVFALAATISWSISGAGSSAAPWLARRTGGWVNAAIATRVAQGAGVLVAGLVAGPAGLLTGYLGFYLFHGAANVAHSGLLNRSVGATHRATMISVNSLTSRLGGVIGAPLLGLVATGAGSAWVFVAAAVLLAAGGPLYLLARPSPAGADGAPPALEGSA